jgi:hypothetical protein
MGMLPQLAGLPTVERIAVTETTAEAERSSSCTCRTTTYGGYKVFAKFDL